MTAPAATPPEIPAGAQRIIARLRQAGFQALLAGGCVRDWLMGRRPKDWDVATDADPEQVAALFDRTVPVGARFGVVLILEGDSQYEVARFRRDGAYSDGRRPASVEYADAEADARRRDFTINGMFYDPQGKGLVDYVGGQADITARQIRAIGAPASRFAEDHLRLLRAVRFAARLDFSIEAQTWTAIGDAAGLIGRISPERVRDELTLILTEGGASRGMDLLHQSGLLAQVLPEVAAMDGVGQPPEFHPEGDVWTHVKLMLDLMGTAPGMQLAWGVLLHDIGKPPTYQEADRIRFNGHDTIGAQMAEAICRRLRLSNEEGEEIVDLVAQHMRFGNVRQMRASKLKRFIRQPIFAKLLELHRLDCLGSHAKMDLYEFCSQKLEEIDTEALQPPRLLSGRDLIELGLKPGPLFKEILREAEDEQLEGRLSNPEQARQWAKDRYVDAAEAD
jgi:poly(A) polymerase